MGDAKLLPIGNRNVFHDRPMSVFQFRETRINVPVEDVSLKQLNHFGSRMDAYRACKCFKKIVDENWQTGNVVHVRVSDNYVAHFCSLLGGQCQSYTAGVNSNTLVDEKTCQTLFEGSVALTIKGAW